MQINAALRLKQAAIIEQPCIIADILELPESEYASLYQNLLKERGYFSGMKDMECFSDGQRCCALILGELKSLPKGEFVVMKTGVHPMRVKLKLFFKWGIQFDEKNPYTVPDNGGRTVEYAEKKEISDGIMKKYHPNLPPKEEEKKPTGKKDTEKQSPKEQPRPKPGKGGTQMRPVPPSRRTPLNKQEGPPHEPS